ncbi:hypothetical protein CXF84_13225, partial [Shewanella sp. Bg11-22]
MLFQPSADAAEAFDGMANSVPYRIWHFLRPWRSDVFVELTWTLYFIKSCSEPQLRQHIRDRKSLEPPLSEGNALLPRNESETSSNGIDSGSIGLSKKGWLDIQYYWLSCGNRS